MKGTCTLCKTHGKLRKHGVYFTKSESSTKFVVEAVGLYNWERAVGSCKESP